MELPQQGSSSSDQEAAAKNGSVLCRQSSTRWTPTTEQIRILKELYYNNGVRSPSAEQIQRISAKLRQYGKIEGKNVFYWFQNHKARERQKKRFTADHHHHHHHHIPSAPIHRPSPPAAQPAAAYHLYNKFSNISTGGFPSSASGSSPGVLSHVGSYGYGASMAMENSFRDCSTSPNGYDGGSLGQNYAWIGADPYSFLDQRKYTINNVGDQTLEVEPGDDEDQAAMPEIETLPLFPVHGDNVKHESDYFNGWNHRGGDDSIVAGSRASLELTLNSYAARFPTSP